VVLPIPDMVVRGKAIEGAEDFRLAQQPLTLPSFAWAPPLYLDCGAGA